MNDEQGIAVKNTRNLPYLDLSTLEYTKMAVCTSLRTARDQMLKQKTQHLASLSVLKFHIGTLYNIQLS